MKAPWTSSLTPAEYELINYFLLLGALVLLAGVVRAWMTRGEVGTRYRPAVVARLSISATASIAYGVLVVQQHLGYRYENGLYVPNVEAVHAFSTRYVDWSVTVPLLVIEIVAVSTFVGRRARRARYTGVAAAFAMIFCGYLGAIVIDGGENPGQVLMWGAVSAVFWVLTTAIVVRAVRHSLPELTRKPALLLRHSAFLLLIGWAVYPVLYLVPVLTSGGAWSTVMQVGFTVTDIAVKVGTGTLIHRVAKLRTAEDVRTGVDLHPETLWVSSIKRADAGAAPVVNIAAVAAVNPPGARPLANRVMPGVRYDGIEDENE